MDKKIVEVAELSTEGFKPLIFFKDWRVATLCYTADLYPPDIGYLERHMETDEVFVLMHGQATLLLGGLEQAVSPLVALPMQPLKTYNVRLGAWHSVVMSKDAVILLVENADTGKPNSEYFQLTPAMKQVVFSEAVHFPDWRSLH